MNFWYTRLLSTIFVFTKTDITYRLSKEIYNSWYVSDLFLSSNSSNTNDFDRRYHCCCICWEDLCLSLSYRKEQGVCGSSARQDINALPSSVIPFHIIGIHVASKICRGSSDPCEDEPLSHCISIKTSFISHSVTLEAVLLGSYCNSYNGYSVLIIYVHINGPWIKYINTSILSIENAHVL